ncbi:MAG: fumarylacetoacetate hydrolase family protein [Synergistales bacterium]|nr:fumarylacetoacetate hydrolase family protein [Synergistales bacterium]
MRCIVKGREVQGLCDGEGAPIALLEGSYFEGGARPTGQTAAFEDVERFLPPATPGKIIAIGLNYRDHAEETGHAIPTEPLLFMKPSSAVVGHGAEVWYPPQVGRLDYEAELGIVIGRKAFRIDEADALDAVLGYTCANDVTARDLQQRDGQWTRCKSFDTFAPLGPWILLDSDPRPREISMHHNGAVVQHSTTANFIFDVPFLVAYISSVMTLSPGDVIITGTPAGIGPVAPGDEMTVTVEGIGRLTNRIGR